MAARRILKSHVREGDYRRSIVHSVVGHVALLLFFLFGVQLLPGPAPIKLGTGLGGGQGGDFVTVGLSADLGGGAGMYKDPITPPAPSPPPPKPVEKKAETPPPDESVFLEEKVEKKAPAPEPQPRRRPDPPKPSSTKGAIAREPDPGTGGPGGGASGSGGGFGSGQGVSIGSGSGEESGIDSWYIRQVEQRIGRNWLRTSLGKLSRVEAIATFVVRPNGQIDQIELEQNSGVRSVDRAVLRAIQASNPLPPLPYELRGRPVRFQAVFEYPPR